MVSGPSDRPKRGSQKRPPADIPSINVYSASRQSVIATIDLAAKTRIETECGCSATTPTVSGGATVVGVRIITAKGASKAHRCGRHGRGERNCSKRCGADGPQQSRTG